MVARKLFNGFWKEKNFLYFNFKFFFNISYRRVLLLFRPFCVGLSKNEKHFGNFNYKNCFLCFFDLNLRSLNSSAIITCHQSIEKGTWIQKNKY